MYLLLVVVLFGAVGTFLLAGSHASGSGTLSLSPASGQISLGANVAVTIVEGSGSVAVNAVEADLTYDQTKLQFVSIDTSTSPFNLSASKTGGNGTVSVASGASPSVTGNQTVAIVNFTALATGSTTISFTNSSGLAQASDSTNILGTMTGATYTIADTTAPSVPANITSPSQTATSISLSWSASTDNVGVSGYRVYRGGTLIGTTNGTSYTDTGLKPSNSYTYTLAAYDAAGNTSAQSAGKSFSTTPDTTAPSKPDGLTLGTSTVTSISFSWNASTDDVGVAGYKIYRDGTQVGTSSTTSYTDTGLNPSSTYGYTIAAYDAAGNTSDTWPGKSFSTLADTTAPSVPTNLTSPSQTTTSVSLTWSASTDNVAVSGYKIYRNGTQVSTSSVASFTDTGLLNGTSYTYTVAAYDAAGNTSAQSVSKTVTTTTVPGDANHDGHVDFLDLSILSATWQSTTDLRADFNHDGIVNFLDLSILSTNWGT